MLLLLLAFSSEAQLLDKLKKNMKEKKEKVTGKQTPDIIEPDDVPPFSEAVKPGENTGTSSAYSIVTLAGVGDTRKGSKRAGKGFVDGKGRVAEFDNPVSIVSDGKGNLLIVDAGNYSIRQMDASFNVTTIAGIGQQGDNDGPLTEARFYYPVSMVRLKNGDLIVVEKNNNVIRRVSGGTLTTMAGQSSDPYRVSWKDGPLLESFFNRPVTVAVNSKDEIFICDEGNYCIRKIANGVVSTYAGIPNEEGYADGSAATAKFTRPSGIVFDAEDNLFVADGCMIRKITPGGVVSTFAGMHEQHDRKDGVARQARFNKIRALAISPSGNIYLADDQFKGRDGDEIVICKVTPAGVVSTFADGLTEAEYNRMLADKVGWDNAHVFSTGTPVGDGPVHQAYFKHIAGMYVDARENIYIADAFHHCIRKISPR